MLAPLAQALATEWRPLRELAPLAPQWRELAARAAEPNVFYEPAFALAAAPVFGADVAAVLVWAADGRLAGLFPLRRVRHRYALPFPLLVGWTHPFAPLGTPLIDAEMARPVIEAFLDQVAGAASCLLLPFLADDGPVAAAFDAALARRGARQAAFGAHRRALLVPARPPALDRRKRKELERQRRRLADLGALALARISEPEGVAAALADFLALEAKGWKGRAGSAAGADPRLRTFMEAAVAALAAEGKAAAARLSLDDRPIACGLTLRSGRGAWFWKIAYDEAFAHYSPGVILTRDLTQALLREGPAFVDSCAAPDHPMIDHLWRDRLALCDRLVELRSGGAFPLVRRLETLRCSVVAAAKRARDLVARR